MSIQKHEYLYCVLKLISYAIPRRVNSNINMIYMSIQKKEYLHCVLKLLQLGVL